MANIPGSVTVTGFIAPTDSTDTYAVTDPLYGIDGLRSVADHTTRNSITNARRRVGMLVYTQSDGFYWQLLASPWSGSDSDWTQLVLGGSGSQGYQGYQGSIGYQGSMGYQGFQGAASTVPGPQGNQGVTGAGFQGAASTVPGPQGNQGATGAGFQGPVGRASTVPGPQGNVGYQGRQGSQGIPGPLSPTYVYTQSPADSTWTINHNMDKYPSVTSFDDTSVEIFGEVAYVDGNTLNIFFTSSVAGTAYLN